MDALFYQVHYYNSCSPSNSTLNNRIDYFHILSPKTQVVAVSCFISAGYFNDPGHWALANEKQTSKPDFTFRRELELEGEGGQDQPPHFPTSRRLEALPLEPLIMRN